MQWKRICARWVGRISRLSMKTLSPSSNQNTAFSRASGPRWSARRCSPLRRRTQHHWVNVRAKQRLSMVCARTRPSHHLSPALTRLARMVMAPRARKSALPVAQHHLIHRLVNRHPSQRDSPPLMPSGSARSIRVRDLGSSHIPSPYVRSKRLASCITGSIPRGLVGRILSNRPASCRLPSDYANHDLLSCSLMLPVHVDR